MVKKKSIMSFFKNKKIKAALSGKVGRKKIKISIYLV